MKKIFFLLFLIPTLSFAQLDTLDCYAPEIGRIYKYAQEVIQKDANVEKLRRLTIKWYRTERDVVKLNRVVNQFYFATVVRKRSLKSYQEQARKIGYDRKLLSQFKKKHIALFAESAALFNLFDERYIDLSFREDRVYLQKFCAELDFYELSSGNDVAEIGAGNGVFGLLLLKGGWDINIVINELDEKLIGYANSIYADHLSPFEQMRIRVVKGDKDNINIQQKMDKIIIRNSFHHFDEKEAMLLSIKQALKVDGALYVKELFRNESDEEDEDAGCKLRMSKEEILEIMEGNGFILADEKMVGKVTLMKFVHGELVRGE